MTALAFSCRVAFAGMGFFSRHLEGAIFSSAIQNGCLCRLDAVQQVRQQAFDTRSLETGRHCHIVAVSIPANLLEKLSSVWSFLLASVLSLSLRLLPKSYVSPLLQMARR